MRKRTSSIVIVWMVLAALVPSVAAQSQNACSALSYAKQVDTWNSRVEIPQYFNYLFFTQNVPQVAATITQALNNLRSSCLANFQSFVTGTTYAQAAAACLQACARNNTPTFVCSGTATPTEDCSTQPLSLVGNCAQYNGPVVSNQGSYPSIALTICTMTGHFGIDCQCSGGGGPVDK